MSWFRRKPPAPHVPVVQFHHGQPTRGTVPGGTVPPVVEQPVSTNEAPPTYAEDIPDVPGSPGSVYVPVKGSRFDLYTVEEWTPWNAAEKPHPVEKPVGTNATEPCPVVVVGVQYPRPGCPFPVRTTHPMRVTSECGTLNGYLRHYFDRESHPCEDCADVLDDLERAVGASPELRDENARLFSEADEWEREHVKRDRERCSAADHSPLLCQRAIDAEFTFMVEAEQMWRLGVNLAVAVARHRAEEVEATKRIVAEETLAWQVVMNDPNGLFADDEEPDEEQPERKLHRDLPDEVVVPFNLGADLTYLGTLVAEASTLGFAYELDFEPRCGEVVHSYHPDLVADWSPATVTEECGTLPGYFRHERDGEVWCDACDVAFRRHERDSGRSPSLRAQHNNGWWGLVVSGMRVEAVLAEPCRNAGHRPEQCPEWTARVRAARAEEELASCLAVESEQQRQDDEFREEQFRRADAQRTGAPVVSVRRILDTVSTNK